MSIDTVIIAVSTVSGLALTLMGLFPPSENDKPKKKLFRCLAFVFGILVVGATFVQGARNDKTQRDAQERVQELRDKLIAQNGKLDVIASVGNTVLSTISGSKCVNEATLRSLIRVSREARVPIENNLKNVGDARLAEMARDNGLQLAEFVQNWSAWRQNEYLKTDDRLTYHDDPPEERARLVKQQQDDIARVAKEYWVDQKGRDRFKEVDDIRGEIIQRLHSQKSNDDQMNETYLKSLLAGKDIPDVDFVPMEHVAQYMMNLSKRFALQMGIK